MIALSFSKCRWNTKSCYIAQSSVKLRIVSIIYWSTSDIWVLARVVYDSSFKALAVLYFIIRYLYFVLF